MLLVHALSLLEPAVLAVSPHPNNTTTGGGRINIASSKDTSDGLNFELKVFYSLHQKPNCKDEPDDQITAAPGECTCLTLSLSLSRSLSLSLCLYVCVF